MAAVALLLSIGTSVAAESRASEGASAPEQRIPFKRTEDSSWVGTALRTLLALGVVVAVGFGVVYALKRYLPGIAGMSTAANDQIRLVEIRRLTPRVTLFLVDVQGTRLLIGQAGDHIASLHSFAADKQGE